MANGAVGAQIYRHANAHQQCLILTPASKFIQKVQNLRAGPILRADEFTTHETVFIDDIGFWNLHGAIEGIDPLIRITKSREVDVMTGQEAVISIWILIDAYGNNIDLWPPFVKFKEAGKLFDAGRTIGGPEIENDGVAAQSTEIYAIGAIGKRELRSELVNIAGMLTTVTTSHYQQKKNETW